MSLSVESSHYTRVVLGFCHLICTCNEMGILLCFMQINCNFMARKIFQEFFSAKTLREPLS